jgi:hypothetical protein
MDFAAFEAAASTSYFWADLPTDGWNGYTTDPDIFLPFVSDDDEDGDPESVSMIHQVFGGNELPKLIHTYGWCTWNTSPTTWTAYWEYFSASPTPPNAPAYRELNDTMTNSHDGHVVITTGEGGSIVGGFSNDSGSPADLLSIGIYAVRYADHDEAGTSYPPWA